MKKLSLLAGCVLIFLSLAMQGQAATKAGNFTFIKGIVKVKRKGSITRASRSIPLKVGDTIITEAGAAQVRLSGGERLHIRKNSRVVLNRHHLSGNSRKTKITLKKGSLFAKVKRLKKGSFNVRTPSATAGVRGTEFFIEVKEKEINGKQIVVTVVEVVEGVVGVKGSYGEEISVKKDHGTEVQEDSPASEAKSIMPQTIRWR